MKTIIINASPRKNMNTAMILKSALKGAEAAGSDVEYIDLYDINCTGCRSCLACKRKSAPDACKCYWSDGLSPILEKIYSADRLIIGSPIFYGSTTSQFHALMERLCFPAMSYNNYQSTFNGKVDVDIFLTMNVDEKRYEQNYAQKFSTEFATFRYLNGYIHTHPMFDTMQVDDYSKYEMASWNAELKRESREKRFPIDLDKAYLIGKGE